jgi:hypothetical protein
MPRLGLCGDSPGGGGARRDRINLAFVGHDDGLQRETFARGNRHRAGLAVALLDNRLGSESQCSVYAERYRAKLESSLPGRQAIPDE